MPSMLKFYYMLSMSYYIEDVIVHLFQTPQFDFWEMILHHIVALMLLLDSYFFDISNKIIQIDPYS